MPTHIPRYLINLVAGGRITITASDGSELTTDDVELFRTIISNHIRSENMLKYRSKDRPEPNTIVRTRYKGTENFKGVEHMYDPIVNFLTVFRRKRRIQLRPVAELAGCSTSKLTQLELGTSRPFLDFVRDWAYALGFDLMVVPVKMRPALQRRINRYLETQYLKDLNKWGDQPIFFRSGVNSVADFSPGAEFLRDSDHIGSQAIGETEDRDVSDPRESGGPDGQLGSSSSDPDVEGLRVDPDAVRTDDLC